MRRISRERTELGQEAGDGVDLYWLPLGAGNVIVQLTGHVFEAIAARRAARPAQQLYHSALIVHAGDQHVVIEMTPAMRRPEDRGVVAVGPVGVRWPRRSRAYCYEIRRWGSGVVDHAGSAVGGRRRVSSDPATARQLLDLAAGVPTLTWGRDELQTGDMWNSNSVSAWLLKSSGHDMSAIYPPPGGRAPGWTAGLVIAGRRVVPACR